MVELCLPWPVDTKKSDSFRPWILVAAKKVIDGCRWHRNGPILRKMSNGMGGVDLSLLEKKYEETNQITMFFNVEPSGALAA